MQRSMWGTCGGLFGANYVLYFEITWLPFYLVRERHLSMGTMAKIGGLGYLCYAAAAVVFGWISDRWIADSCSQNFCACRSGDCRAIPPWLHPRRSHGLCYSAATSVRSRWHVRIQYLGDHTNAGRSENGGPMDGLAEFPRKSCRCQRAGSDRIRNRLHRTFFVAFVIMAFVALLAAVSYVFVIGPVKEIAWEG